MPAAVRLVKGCIADGRRLLVHCCERNFPFHKEKK
jgi:hypothetical protein